MKKLSLSAVLFVSSLYLLFSYEMIKFTLINDLKIGWVFSDITTRILPFVFLIIGLSVLFSTFKKFNKAPNCILAIVISFTVNFAVNPIYVDDYGIVETKKELDFDLLNTHFPELLSSTEPVVVAFFTSTCPFCKSSSRNFQLNKNAGKQPKTVILFPSVKEDAEDFLKQSKSDFDYALITDEEFLKNAGNRFPSVFLIQNGEVLNHWVGSEINYSVLDLMRTLAD